MGDARRHSTSYISDGVRVQLFQLRSVFTAFQEQCSHLTHDSGLHHGICRLVHEAPISETHHAPAERSTNHGLCLQILGTRRESSMQAV